MKTFKKLAKFFSKIIPTMQVGGLWISDGLVSFYGVGRSGSSNQITLRLPPGIIEGGAVKNKEALTKILIELYKRTGRVSRTSQSVILTIPIENIYVQPFTLPAIAEGSLGESADLNMKMISPIDIERAYYDWQMVDRENGEQLEMMGAFIEKDIVDDLVQSVQQAGYSVAAVEFNTLSLIRAAANSKIIEEGNPYMFIESLPEGINFSISHVGKLFFHNFLSWNILRDGSKDISKAKLQESLIEEVRRITNFYSTNRKGEEIKEVILVSTGFASDIEAILKDRFPGLAVKIVDPKKINPALGAALRGMIPRSIDSDISLASLSAMEVFQKYQLTNFILVWRNILFTTLGFLLLVFLSSNILLNRTTAQILSSDPYSSLNIDRQELLTLEGTAQKFNMLVGMVSKLQNEDRDLYPLLDAIDSLSGPSISISRINFQGSNSKLILEGSGQSEERVIEFKNKLNGTPQFKDVALPLSSIKPEPGGVFSFNLTLQVISFDF